MLRNPALTGIFSGDYKMGVNYRNQWSTISVPYQTFLASFETRINISSESYDCISFGLTCTQDKAGSIDFLSTQIYPTFSYNKSMQDAHHTYLSSGFTLGYNQRAIDITKMTFSSQYFGGTYNPGFPTGENITDSKLTFLDLGAGVSVNSSLGTENNMNYYIGLAAFHINKPRAAFSSNEAFVRMDAKINANMGMSYQLNNEFGMLAHVNYSTQGKYQEAIGGVQFSYRNYDAAKQLVFTFSAGCYYRLLDAFIPTFKLDYNQYTFTLSYDVNSSQLKTVSRGQGGMELSIFKRGFIYRKPWTEDKTHCPRFEQMILPNYEQ
jgi:type IX secretion system PorP/SprF family membrane protein